MTYQPEKRDVVVFTDTYDAVTEYVVTDVTPNRVEVESVEPVPGTGSHAKFDLSREMFADMGAAKVATGITPLEGLRMVWALALVDLLETVEMGLTIAAAFGNEVAEMVMPIADLSAQADALKAFGDFITFLESLSGAEALATQLEAAGLV